MNKNSFVEFVEEHVSDYFDENRPGTGICIKQVEKASGSYLGLLVQDLEVLVSPTFNLDDIYERYEEPLEAVNFIIDTYNGALKDIKEGKMSEIEDAMEIFGDYEKAKKRLVVAPISAERAQALTDAVQTEMYGMHFIVKVIISRQEDATATATVNTGHISNWGVDEETLFEDAWKSTKELRPGKLRSMMEVLRGYVEEIPELFELPEDEMMYVYTNNENIDGASSLFVDGALKDIAEQLKDSFYIITSSIHENLIIREGMFGVGEDEIRQLCDMLRDGNLSLVQPEEVASSTPYHYDRSNGVFETVGAFAKRRLQRAIA